MSIPAIELIKTDDIYVKEECDFNFELENEAETAGIGVLNVRTNHTKCGEILVSDEKKFILICSLCEEFYVSMIDFGEHFVEKHLQIKDIFVETEDADTSKGKNDEELLPDQAEETLVDKPVVVVESLPISKVEKNARVPIVLLKRLNELQPQTNEKDLASNAGTDENDKDAMRNENDLDYSKDKSDDSDSKIGTRRTLKKITKPNLFCEACGIQYKRASTYRSHIKKMHDDKKRMRDSLKCMYCDKEFATGLELREHKNIHNPDRPFQCPQCPKSFSSSSNRQKHLNVHMGVRPYKCTKCLRSFSAEFNLRHHMLTHAVAGTLSCDICGRQFIHQNQKNIHMRLHTGEKPFQCELCDSKFIIRSRLNEHMKRHNNKRDHECEVCGKKFYTNSLLKYHQVVHSSDRPFECTECGKRFLRKLALKLHQIVHSEGKQYACNICGKEYRHSSGLYAHRKKHGEKKGLPKTNIAISDKFTRPTHLLTVRGEDMSCKDAS